MASSLTRVLFRGGRHLKNSHEINNVMKRTISVSSPRHREDPKVVKASINMEKYALEARRAQNDNPFDIYAIKPDPISGMSEKVPILIPSMGESRMVGCCCEDDYGEVVWFNLEAKNGVQKCDCGYYFKLIPHDPLDKSIQPKFGKGYGSGTSPYY